MKLLSSVASHCLLRALRLGGLLACCAIAAACGQKGGLMLPPAPGAVPAAPAASAAAPLPTR